MQMAAGDFEGNFPVWKLHIVWVWCHIMSPAEKGGMTFFVVFFVEICISSRAEKNEDVVCFPWFFSNKKHSGIS